MWTRRRILSTAPALLGGAALGSLWPTQRALAATSGNNLKFIFVINYGGWDPTRVFANEFWNPMVDMESSAQVGQFGDLSFVDHENRPAVREFFEKYYSRSVIFNGMQVPSVAHENCLRIVMTGTTAQDSADWGAILGGMGADAYALPQVVLGAPSFPGAFGTYVTRTGTTGQLQGLISGDIASWSDKPVGQPDWRSEDIMDSYLKRRLAAAADAAAAGRDATLRAAMETAVTRGVALKDLVGVVDFSGASSFGGQLDLAVQLLSLQVTRVASVAFSYYGWDTHINNDLYQSANFQEMFRNLNTLMQTLESTPGESAATLADETVIVVLSEMGRTPQLNSGDGKDHWPYTSAMVVGPGLRGGRVIGANDAYYYGQLVDLASGEVSESGSNFNSQVLGATLLAMADIDPNDFVSGVEPITGILE